MASELSKIGLPKVDKLCDAKWVKTIFNTSKKEFAHFVEKTPEMKDFMKGIEDRIGEAHEEWRDLIRKYLDRVTVKTRADEFKSDLKEAEREIRRLKKKEEAEAKKNERERLKEELRQEMIEEMADEKEKAKLEARAGVQPKKKMSFKKDDIRNRNDDSSLKMSFKNDQDQMEGTRKKVVFKKTESDLTTNQRKIDLATLSAFISKTAGMGRLGIQDQNESELSFVGCDVIKNTVILSVKIDFETILGSMIREGRFKMMTSKGETIDITEMSVSSSGKIELIVD